MVGWHHQLNGHESEQTPGEALVGLGNTCWPTVIYICCIMEKAREFQKNIYFCFIDYAKAFDCVDHNKLWKILKEMGKNIKQKIKKKQPNKKNITKKPSLLTPTPRTGGKPFH